MEFLFSWKLGVVVWLLFLENFPPYVRGRVTNEIKFSTSFCRKGNRGNFSLHPIFSLGTRENMQIQNFSNLSFKVFLKSSFLSFNEIFRNKTFFDLFISEEELEFWINVSPNELLYKYISILNTFFLDLTINKIDLCNWCLLSHIMTHKKRKIFGSRKLSQIQKMYF